MHLYRLARVGLLSCALGLLAGPVRAGLVTGLYNTGVDSNNVTLGESPVADQHWDLVSSPVGPGSAYIVPNGAFPIPPWVANDVAGTAGGSKWISGPATPPQSVPNGEYLYQLINGFTVSTAGTYAFSGKYSADDQTNILIDGTQVVSLTPDQGYGSLYNYSFSVSLAAGAHSLQLGAENTHGSVEGVRLSIEAVPEPSTLVGVLSTMPVLGLGLWMRRRGA